MTDQEKLELKVAKSQWRRRMNRLHPGFKKKQWVRTSYRMTHLQ